MKGVSMKKLLSIVVLLGLFQLAFAATPIPIKLTQNATNTCVIPSRQSGVAPLFVQVDAKCTTNTSRTALPFHELEYKWDFGDTGAGAWTYGARTAAGSKNVAYGPIAGHVFEAAGDYTITLTVTDGSNPVATQTVQITVTDISAANTYCIANGSTPSPGVDAGCPAGATGVNQGNWPTIVSTYATAGKKVLLKGGDIFTGAATAMLNNVTGPTIIGSYPANNTKAIIRTTGTASNSVLLSIRNATDVRLVDLEFDGQSNASRQGMLSNAPTTLNRFLMLRLNLHDLGGGIELPAELGASYPSEVALVDSIVYNMLSASTASGHGILMHGKKSALIGNWFDRTNAGTAEHLIRISSMQDSVISNNTLERSNVTKEMLALRGFCTVAVGGTCDLTYGMAGDAAATKYVVVSDNWFTQNSYTPIQLDQVSPTDTTRIRDVIIERNYIAAVTGGGSRWSTIRATYVTVRNNIVVNPLATDQSGISLENATAGTPKASYIFIYHNTIYSLAATGFTGIGTNWWITSDVVIRNNLGYSPVAVSPNMSYPYGTATDNNNSTNAQLVVNPLVTTTPPTLPIHLKSTCTGTTYPCAKGTSVPVWTDFGGNAFVGTRDLGAWQH